MRASPRRYDPVFYVQVKLDPRNADAWNALGANYWKKGDVVNAKSCFEGGATQVRLPAAEICLGATMYSSDVCAHALT